MPKRRKAVVEESSSSSDNEPLSKLCSSTPNNPVKTNEESSRRSDRIKKRQNREFHMPTRSDIFDQIDSELASPNKSYSHLQPRKLVNNFVKVNNRYNFDPDLTDGESSIESFIVGDSCEESEPSSDQHSQPDSTAGCQPHSSMLSNGIIDDDDEESENDDGTDADDDDEIQSPKSAQLRRSFIIDSDDSDREDSASKERTPPEPHRTPSSRAAVMAERRAQEKEKFAELRQRVRKRSSNKT